MSPATQQVEPGGTVTVTVTPISPAVLLKLQDTTGGVTTDVTSKVTSGVYTLTNVTADHSHHGHVRAHHDRHPLRADQLSPRNTPAPGRGSPLREPRAAATRTPTARDGSVTIAFYGTAITWLTTKDRTFGNAYVYLDGALVATKDLYASSTTYKVAVWRARRT